MTWYLGLIFYVMIGAVNSFHDADNVRYDCWPLGAVDGDATIDCDGLGLEWVEPPGQVETFQKFNITYYPIVANRNSFYASNGNSIFPNKSAEFIANLCHNTSSCPEDPADATAENCCVWHANIHTCHPTVTGVCGPWVANNGQLSTHTVTQIGSLDMVFFAENVQIDFEGPNFVIAHLRVGSIQIALGKSVEVIARRVCGDGLCTTEIGETCDSCATDCCGISFPTGATAGIVVFCLLVPTAVAVAILGWYCYQRRKLFFDEGWIINYDDIQKEPKGLVHMGSLASIKRSSDNLKRHKSEYDDLLAGLESDTRLSSSNNRQLFTKTGVYEGRPVALKRMKRSDLVLNDAIRKEVVQIRVLDHPNLCKFVGATVKSLRNLYIVNEYCPKGSLNDVLQNDDIPLNWGFRFSFASDTARGMAYLHSKRIYHGRLTSSNCTIDDRWVLKIADYGLPSFHERGPRSLGIQKVSSCDTLDEDRKNQSRKIYQAPEIMGQTSVTATPSADVYSYSVILVEIATRMDPFSEESTLMFLDSNSRPVLNKSHLTTSDTPCPCPSQYLELVDRCWAFFPASRPAFDQIKRVIDRINPCRESPVDMMMIMMEKYSKHLESLVAERTQELIAEQRKTAALLYNMLPRQVADDLKQGKPPPAKLFQSATIFFSDIVGFTTLASSSTPFEIVNLLNKLYSTFDDILDQFDVYKVETIGDAYMVVSGVPRENGDAHAGEIAAMSLSLLNAVKKFKVPHRPDMKLEIRIGIHSGPVCAGVVGLKMPRYCLFGDTVNTASRMESNSEAMKIQCSDTTYQLLKKVGDFKMECRGSIDIKGKGLMVTWWLVGTQEMDRQPQDSLTGINLIRSESARPLKSSLKKKRSSGGMVACSMSENSPLRSGSYTQATGTSASNGTAVSARDALPGCVNY